MFKHHQLQLQSPQARSAAASLCCNVQSARCLMWHCDVGNMLRILLGCASGCYRQSPDATAMLRLVGSRNFGDGCGSQHVQPAALCVGWVCWSFEHCKLSRCGARHLFSVPAARADSGVNQMKAKRQLLPVRGWFSNRFGVVHTFATVMQHQQYATKSGR
jgi:hypothetical protein